MTDFLRLLKILGVLIWLLSGPLSALGVSDQWDPKRTRVFIVGILEWKRSDAWPAFPKTNRRDLRLVQAFKNLGIPPQQIVHLMDRQATQSAIREQFKVLLGATQPGELLVVYYAGHGYRQESDRTFWMVPYDGYDLPTLWGMTELEESIVKGFKGTRVMMAADCCHSGSLRRFVRSSTSNLGLAAFSSSTARLSSTGNWTFTDCLLDALAGDPRFDLDGDGWITLAELSTLIAKDMFFAEDQRAGGSGSARFPLETRWIRTARPRRTDEGKYANVLYGSQFWKARILDRSMRGVLVRWMGLAHDYPDEWVPDDTVQVVPVAPPPRSRGTAPASGQPAPVRDPVWDGGVLR